MLGHFEMFAGFGNKILKQAGINVGCRRWLRSVLTRRCGDGQVALAVEGCTGWRYVVEEIDAAGFEAHLAEPADTQAARGRKHRAKTDRTDARLLRDLLASGELPASWIPPTPVPRSDKRPGIWPPLRSTGGRSASSEWR